MDRDEVIATLLQRAGIDKLDEIESKIASQKNRLSEFKEQAISLLTSLLGANDDAFVSRKLAQIEKIKLAAPGEIASSLVQRGQVISRDMTAMGQGRWIAPHQSLIAVSLSATVVQNGLESLGQAIGLVAQHVSRSKGMKADTGRSFGTNVVIGHGHSPAWKDLREFVRDRLKLSFDEFNRVPVAGIPNAIRLNQMLDGAAIAFVVLTAEDEQLDGTIRARENVVHEAGLFQGRLGFTKAIVLLEDGCNQFSNIEGLGQIRFPRGNISAAFEEIRKVLEREGLLET
jgi:predicted nucleotide-binding protein